MGKWYFVDKEHYDIRGEIFFSPHGVLWAYDDGPEAYCFQFAEYGCELLGRSLFFKDEDSRFNFCSRE